MNRYRSRRVCTITSSLKPSSRYAAAARYLVTSTAGCSAAGSVTSTRSSGASMRSVTSNRAPCAHGRQLRASTLEQTREASALTTNVCALSRLPGSEKLLNKSLQNGKHMFDSVGGRAYVGGHGSPPCTAAPWDLVGALPPGPPNFGDLSLGSI